MNAAATLTSRLADLATPRFGSLTVRIAVLYTALFAIVLAGFIVLAGGGLARFGEVNSSRDLQSNARVFEEILDLRAGQMEQSAEVLARDFGFREAVATDDQATIISALDSLGDRAGAETAFVITNEGQTIGALATQAYNGFGIWNGLKAGVTRGIVRAGEGFALAAASPILAPDRIGWLIIVQPLDGVELLKLQELAPIPLEAQVVPATGQPDWFGDQRGEALTRTEEGERYLYHVSRLQALEDGIGPQLVLRHSHTRSLAEYSSLVWLLAGMAIFAIWLVVALSWSVARTVTRPLKRLAKATREIGAGRKVHLAIDSDDEVGRLASHFNAMIAAIEDREREIINAQHDPLTGLSNRKLFTEQFERMLDRRKPDDRILIAYADLDNFKDVNDTLGHPAGDALLCDIAEYLGAAMPEALVARFGGDEFAILIEGIGPHDSINALADKLQHCFDRTVLIDGNRADASASLGIAIAPSDGVSRSTLMKNADLALYRAKNEGKSQYHFFEESLDQVAQERREMENDLRNSLDNNELSLKFQPIYRTVDQRIVGFEALLRWNHTKRGLVMPSEFIPIAEDTNLIVPIGEWALREACTIASGWPDDLPVSVNLSEKQFRSPGLASAIMLALKTSGLEPHRLEIEITEAIFARDATKALTILQGLRDLGVRITLDDFGTGYSSLSYLRAFPFDKVKIDRSFVRDVHENSAKVTVIRAVTMLAESLGMKALAEGVENRAQLNAVANQGCHYVQGYLLSEPVPSDEVKALIGSGQVKQHATAI